MASTTDPAGLLIERERERGHGPYGLAWRALAVSNSDHVLQCYISTCYIYYMLLNIYLSYRMIDIYRHTMIIYLRGIGLLYAVQPSLSTSKKLQIYTGLCL